MARSFPFAALAAVFLACAPGLCNALDPAFEKIPFDQWINDQDSKGSPGPFHFTINTPRAELSFHQRLSTAIELKLDGRDLESRRADGRLVFLIQITDHDGTRYQTHGSIELGKLDENVRASNIGYSQRAFFLPGEYRVAIAVLDAGTGEHSARQSQFRVPAPPHEFLAAAWHGLPSIELIGKEDSPDSWYLPEIQGRLQWAAAERTASRIDVILNVSAHRANTADLAALIPTVKAISQTGSSVISERVELLDLARRRAAFVQNDAHDLDWPRLKDALAESDTASIDVHSLSARTQNAQFFVSQVRSVLRASQQPCVLVVLTPPVAFESGEDLEPVSAEALPACRVFYLRYRAPFPQTRPIDPRSGGMGRGSHRGAGSMYGPRPQQTVDQLEPTLKPLNPKVFDVETAEQITKALIEIHKALFTP